MEAIGLVGPVITTTEDGLQYELDPSDIIQRHLLLDSHWEQAEWEVLSSHLPVGAVFLDVGAHVGSFTLRAARQVGPAGRVLAIEPNPKTAERLLRNIALNGLSNVAVRRVACAAVSSSAVLYEGSRVNTGSSSLSRQNARLHYGGGVVSHRVSTVPLDVVVDEEGFHRLDAIKIDTEGAEVSVLTGARRTMERFRPSLLLEVSERQLKNANTSLSGLENLLATLDYRRARTVGLNVEYIPVEKTNQVGSIRRDEDRTA